MTPRHAVISVAVISSVAIGAARAPTTIALPGAHAFPESLSAAADGTIYIGSALQGGISRARPGASEATQWIQPAAFGTRSIFGVLADEAAGMLWVCSNDLTAAGIDSPGTGAGSALKGFDLKTGEGKISAPLPGAKATCNDIAVKDGQVYISDESNAQVLQLNAAKSFDVLIHDPLLADIDGLAFGSDGNLYVNSYGHSLLARITIRDGKAAAPVALQTSRPVEHPDGMRPAGDGSLLLVEGTGKLDRVTVRGDQADIETLRDQLIEPSAVTVVGSTAWVAQGQIGLLFDRKHSKEPSLPFQLVAVALSTPKTASGGCAGDNGGLSLPRGFCATVFADNIGHARHLAIDAKGTVYVNTWSGGYYPANDPLPKGGFLVALRDADGDGRAEMTERFGPDKAQGSAGGTGIALYNGALYAEVNDKIVRYALSADALAPRERSQDVLTGMPLHGDHPMHPFVIDSHGSMFIDMGTATNSCQPKNRQPEVPGASPCHELETRGGVWRYDANKTGQAFSPAERYATGIRNAEGMDFDTAGKLYVTQHGRDQLSENWPKLYSAAIGRERPAEELMPLEQGADYGWPECYFDGPLKKLVLAPEYGGDGKQIGVCGEKRAPVAFFPAHWGPNDLAIYKAAAFPAPYRGGAFVAFHGSWNRAPAPQGGFNVVFQPMANGAAAGASIIFADGFAGAHREPGRATFRPSGLAVGPDGALYVSEDMRGRIWRITYNPKAQVTRLQNAPAPVLPPSSADTSTGLNKLPLPEGATRAQLALGLRIFKGAAARGTCSGCHGSDAHGSSVGPDLTSGKWLWSDGSLAAITTTIHNGVPRPKHSDAAMPPDGGAPLSDAQLKAVAAYVWSLGHSGSQGEPH